MVFSNVVPGSFDLPKTECVINGPLRRIVECCKLYGKVALPGGHLDHVVCHRVYRLLRAVKKDALEHYRRHEVFLSYLFGLETDVSVGSGKGYLSRPRVEGWLGFRQFGTLAQVAWAEEP